jgi:hypothetical protein
MKKKETIITSYEDIRPKLKTFTVVNCLAWKFPFKYIGHTAVLYKSEESNQLMVLESTTLNKFSGVTGVQLMPFGAWLKNYPGRVWVRIPQINKVKCLTCGGYHEYEQLGITAKAHAKEFIQKYLGTSYPNLRTAAGRFKLYMAAIDFKLFGVDWFTYKGKDPGIFCTMLVIMFLSHCEIMKESEADAAEWVPDDLRKYGGVFDKNLESCSYGKTQKVCEYGKEIRLK